MSPLSASPPQMFDYQTAETRTIIDFIDYRYGSLVKCRHSIKSSPYRKQASISLYLIACTSLDSLDNLTTIQPLLLFLRKEVIQPHLPIRLPCYDFTPVMCPAFGSSSLAVRSLTSGIAHSHGVTGGVYKTRERIHRDILIRDY